MAHLKLFLQVYEEVQNFLLDDATNRLELDGNRRRYLKQMMDCTCLGGKYNRGLCVVDVAESMVKAKGVSDEELHTVLHRACVCGWMIEILQAHFLVEDDIMDNSKVRRGQPCWYLHPGVTAQFAINDGLILLAWATQLAQHYFKDSAILPEVLRAFHEVDLITAMGQLYDVTSMVNSATLDANVAHANTTDYAEYTPLHYNRIVTYKTAYYTYWLPLMLGLLVSESVDAVDVEVAQEVALLMGRYFQAQDDVMDCFTPPEKLGKVGTDIQEAKCSWLAVTFLSTATPEQVARFKANYGSNDEAKVASIKQLYAESKMQEKFEEYEKGVAAQVGELLARIATRSKPFASSVEVLWKKTYKRSK